MPQPNPILQSTIPGQAIGDWADTTPAPPPGATKISAVVNAIPWLPFTIYVANQLVTNGGSLYICNQEHVSGATFVGTNWTAISGPATGLAIGEPISGATPGYLLKADSSGNLADSGSLTESNLWLPGIVADATTDNYAVIAAYLATLTQGGQNNLVLPPGDIAIGTQLVIPADVILRGSGANNNPIGVIGGTRLIPTPGSSLASVVDLANTNSGLQDINVIGKNGSTQSTSALTIEAITPTLARVGVYYGSGPTLNVSSACVQLIANTLFVKQSGDGSVGQTMNFNGVDAQVTNMVCSSGQAVIAGASNVWTNCHWVQGPGGSTAQACVRDKGGQTFIGCYFDTVVSGSANALVDRTGAFATSTMAGCQFLQHPTVGVTGIPVIQETAVAGAGVLVIGGKFNGYGAGSQFTYFIRSALPSTICVGFDFAGSLSNAFTDITAPSAMFAANLVNGVPFKPWPVVGNDRGLPGMYCPSVAPWCTQSNVIQTANRLYVCRVCPDRDVSMIEATFDVQTAATANDSVDFGVYDATGALLSSIGGVAGKVNGAGPNTVTLTQTLKAGTVYYIAFAYGAVGAVAATISSAALANTLVGILFGSAVGKIECGFAAASYPIPSTMPALTALGNFPIMALRES